MANKLSHLAEFQSLLANYHISEEAKEILENTGLVLLAAPTSSGRNTIMDELVKTGEYLHIVSDTTREKRSKDGAVIEQDGREYWFRSEREVLADLQKGEYVEAEIIHNQQVSGCNIREIEAAHDAGKIAIKDITPTGAQTFRNLKPDTIVVFVLPPNFEEWLRRLQERGELSADEFMRRLHSARQELEIALTTDYYFFVINNTVAEATAEINNIVHDPTPNPDRGNKARALAQELRRDLDAYFTAHPER
jgi:guanylate kinase